MLTSDGNSSSIYLSACKFSILEEGKRERGGARESEKKKENTEKNENVTHTKSANKSRIKCEASCDVISL